MGKGRDAQGRLRSESPLTLLLRLRLNPSAEQEQAVSGLVKDVVLKTGCDHVVMESVPFLRKVCWAAPPT